MQLELLQGRNFSRFSSFSIEPCRGLNVFVGANASGKTQLLKLLFALGLAIEKRGDCRAQELAQCLQGVFAISSLDGLLHYRKEQFELQLSACGLQLEFTYDKQQGSTAHSQGRAASGGEFVYMPSSEVLGQLELLQLAALHAPQAVSLASLDLAAKLARQPQHRSEFSRKTAKAYSYLSSQIGGELQVLQQRLYFVDARQGPMEVNLLSAGQRKLAGLGLLLANGSLRGGSVLFWDEPEAHLNPKSLVMVANLLLELSLLGVQIFITTHSLFLLKQLYLGQQDRPQEPECCYFSFAEQPQATISRAACWSDLPQVLALDAELAQSEEFNNLFKL